jgi:cytochrome P450
VLPPGPRAPTALQTIEWIVRPTRFLRAAQERYGEPFTIRTAWSDAPMVLTSDPEEIKRAYAAPPDVLRGGDAADFLEPFVGRNSLLVLHGDEHLRQRRLVLPPFHGEALKRWTATIAQLTHEHLDAWPTGTPFKAHPRMQ